ncbi:MAG: deoxyribodipyrimidine photo-lyase [Pseudomonadota bacterium]
MVAPIIVWFRNDLRLNDHPALYHAAIEQRPIIPLYILDNEAPGAWRRGGASRWWLHHSLASLQSNLRQRGTNLLLRRGNTSEIICSVARQTGADKVHCSRQFEPWARQLEHHLYERLAEDGVTLVRFTGSLLRDPEGVRTKSGQPFQVFTPFWRALSAQDIRNCRSQPPALLPPSEWPEGEALENWTLCPEKPDWAGGLRETWQPGESGARQQLDAFLATKAETYRYDRDRPDLPGTSQLSPHLHFGEISPAACWHAALLKAAILPAAAEGLEVFRKEIAWREFSYHLLHNWPDLPSSSFRQQFAHFPWRPADESRAAHLQAWQQGRTGYPVVDAGMRELWETGWMHNRVRMITASFLTKHLLIPWQQGEAWFWDCLVDADLASNAASWQWVAGSGADAAPYFRIFNPITQGQKFDPHGDYVRRWVPEISALPDQYIHAPWQCPERILKHYKIKLDATYPLPIVDHKEARERALMAYEHIKAAKLPARK